MDFSKFYKIPIVDSHVHVWSIENADELPKLMNKVGYRYVNIVCTISINQVNFNPEAIYLKVNYPDLFYAFGGLDYTYKLKEIKEYGLSLVEQVERLMNIGFDGIKMVAPSFLFK